MAVNLKPNPKNPRKISDERLEQFKKSLNEYGDISGIVFNRRDGTLVTGHQRNKDFDDTSKLVITKQFEKPTRTGTLATGYILHKGERFSYREVDWDKPKATAAMLAANKNAGSWDIPELKENFKELSSFDINFDLELTMFEPDELRDFGVIDVAAHTRVHGDTGVDEDDVPEKVPAVTKPGYLYELGPHRLLCGDSTEVKDVQKLLNGETVDLVFTDPPYNVNFKYNEYDDTKQDYDKWKITCEGWLAHWKSLTNNIVLTPGCYNLELWCRISEPAHICPWIKTNANTSGRITHLWQWEPIVFIGKFPRKRSNDVFTHYVDSGFLRDPTTGNHPCPKPVRLWEDVVQHFSEENNIIFEPFCGSGTTVITCEKTGRKCFGMEIDPHYCDIIVQRWEKYTGQKAVLTNASKKTIIRKKLALQES